MKKFLVLQHVEHENLGLISKVLEELNVGYKVVKLWEDYELPDVLDYQGLIIMGGPMGIYENYPSMKDEVNVIKKALGKIPVIGFCLGAQLLAYSLGARVYPNVVKGKKVKEIGYYSVELTEDGKKEPVLKRFVSPLRVFQWHGDAFDLPKKANLLATNQNCKNQAFVYGKSAYGFLFHFEFSPKMVKNQIAIDKEWIHQDFDMDEAKLRQEAEENAQLMEDQCRRLFQNFTALAKNV